MSTDICYCPSCHSEKVHLIGPIPASNIFAGRVLEKSIKGGELWKCLSCHLFFRYPRLSKAEIDQLYKSGNPESWQTQPSQRADYQIIREWISGITGIKRILDVGCFDGQLLQFLDGDYQRFGVEIHQAAAQRAQKKGIIILGTDFSDLPAIDGHMDVVLAVDVIEHSYDPKAFLKSLKNLVVADGYIAITTGNTDSSSWRLMGSQYWYCHIAEHLSFINPSWAYIAAKELGLEVVRIDTFSHSKDRMSLSKRLYEALSNFLLKFFPNIFKFLRRFGAGNIDTNRNPELALTPPYWMSAKDHMLVVFKKCN